MLPSIKFPENVVIDLKNGEVTFNETTAKSLADRLADALKHGFELTAQFLTTAAGYVKQGVNRAIAYVQTNAPQAAQAVQNAGSQMYQSVQQHSPKAVEWATDAANSAGQAIVKGSHNVGNMMKDGYNAVSGGIETFMNKVKRVESGGKAGAVSDTGATGLYQFTMGTWNDIAKNHGDRLQAMGIQPALVTGSNKGTVADPRLNTQAQHAYMKILTENNAKNIGSDSPGALYLAHFMGPGGAKAIINAVQSGNGNVPALSVMPPKLQEQMRISPTNMSVVGGKSAEQVLAWADKKMNSSTNVADIGSGAVSQTGQAISGGFHSVGDAAKQMLGGGTVGNAVAGAFGFGGDAASIIDQVINNGGAQAAPVSSAMLGGSGKGVENSAGFQSAMGPMPIRNGGRPSLGVRRPSQTAMGQMEITPAPQKPSYRDDNTDAVVKELRRQKEEVEAKLAELRKEVNAPASSQVPQTPPTSPVPSIDSIPVMINDMGMVMINTYML